MRLRRIVLPAFAVSVAAVVGLSQVAVAAGSFTDDDGTVHEEAIEALAEAGIVDGCAPDLFCPNAPVTRGQFASILDKAFDLAPTSGDHFDDDDGTVFEPAINRVAAANLVSGCSTTNLRLFCPGATLTRAQMATQLDRAFELDSTTTDFFDDDDGIVFEPAINRVAAAEITTGCDAEDPSLFCPGAPVVRAQLAALLARALGLVGEEEPEPTETPTPTETSTEGGGGGGGAGPTNQAPVFTSPTSFDVPENSTPVATLTATDGDGDPVTFSLTGAGADDGNFSITAGGVLSFSAAPDFEDPSDTGTNNVHDIEVAASDGTSSTTQAVTVTVTDVNEAPVAQDDSAGVTEEAPNDGDANDNTDTGNVTSNDDDVDAGDSVAVDRIQGAGDGSVLAVAGATIATGDYGSLSIDTDGSFTYTLDDANPTVDALTSGSLTDDFTYRVTDGALTDSAVLTVTITGANDPAVADDETFSNVACNVEHVVEASAGETAAASGTVVRTFTDNLLDGDTDPEGTALSVVAVGADTTAPFTGTTTLGGSVTVHADGSFVYVPEPGDDTGADTFTYVVEDADGGQDTGTVTLNLTGPCVWFVDNSVNTVDGTGTGTSADPFSSIVDESGTDASPDDAEDAAGTGDTIYVFAGNSDAASSPDEYGGGITMKTGQSLLGEAVDLVVDFGDGPETLVTGSLAARPVIESSAAGSVVSINDVLGVEVAGFELSSLFGVHQVHLLGTTGFGADLHDLVANGSSGVPAIQLEHTGAGASTLRVADSTLRGPGSTALLVFASDGTLEVEVETTTTDGASDLVGMDFIGTGADLFVTSFCDNSIEVAGANAVAFTDVIFDADPSDADFTDDTVRCDDGTTIGQAAAGPVTGNGMVLSGVTGDLSFADLDIAVDGTDATALDVTAAAELNAAAGTGFRLTTDAGTISSGDGPGLTLDPLTAAMTLDSVTATGSATHGISLTDVAGTLTVTGGAISGAGTTAFLIDNGGAGALSTTFGGTITHAGTGAAVDVLDHASGTVTFNGTINATAGTGLQFRNADGTYTFPAQVTLNGGDAAVDILAGSSAAITFANASITNPTGTAFRHDASTSDVTWTTGTVTKNSAGRLVEVTGQTGGTIALGASFTQDVVTGTGIISSGSGGTLAFNGNVDVGSTGNRLLSTGVEVTRSAGSTTFANLDVATHDARGLYKVSTGTLTVTTGTVDVTGLTSGFGVDLDGGTSNVTLTDVNVAGTSGGGVELTSMTGTTNLAGVTISTTIGAGLRAIGAGTINVTGASNTVATTTGTGVELAGTTVGGSNVTLRSVSSDGATSGILLHTTGSTGNFNVTGDGFAAGSGGTIKNTTSDAIRLTNTDGVWLAHMIIGDSTATAGQAPDSTVNVAGDGISLSTADDTTVTDTMIARTGAHGIDGIAVTGLTLTRVDILNAGDADGEHGVAFDDASTNNLDGTMTWTDLVVDGSADHGARIVNNAGTLSLTVAGSGPGEAAFANTTGLAFGSHGLGIEARGTANTTVVVDNVSFTDLEVDGINGYSADTALLDVTVRNSTFVGCAAGACSANGSRFGIHLEPDGFSDLDLDLVDNTMSANNTAIYVQGWGSASVRGSITGNTVGTDGVPFSGSTVGAGLEVHMEQNSTGVLHVDDNVIRGTDWHGMLLMVHGDMSSPMGNPRLDLELTNNTVGTPDDATGFTESVRIVAHSQGTMCADITNNNVAPGSTDGFGPPDDALRLWLRDFGPPSSATFVIDGMPLGNQTTAAVETYVGGNNPMIGSIDADDDLASDDFTGGTCSTV